MATASVANTSHVSAGPKCQHCGNTEARCAFHAGCCGECTHRFGELIYAVDATLTCKSCSDRFPKPKRRGRPPVDCPKCKRAKTTRRGARRLRVVR